MSVIPQDLILYGCATPGDSDVATNIGGAIDKTKLITFADIVAAFLAISEDAGDTSQSITVTYRDAAGNVATEAKSLNGQDAVNFNASPERILKAVKSATCAGAVGIMLQTPTRTGTAQGGASGSITLDTGASAVDQAYRQYVVRITGGTGANQIRRIIDYVGSSKVATVSPAWTTPPNGTSTFAVSPGLVFDKTPNEVMSIYRWFLAAIADAPGGSARDYYDKGFYWNNHASLYFFAAFVKEITDSLGIFDFALEAALDGTTTNGSGNGRQVAPAGLTFNSDQKDVANTGSLTHQKAQAVWGKLTLAAGAQAAKATWSIQLQGQTI